MRSISSVVPWIFVTGTAFIIGAGLYENLVVVPFWADGEGNILEHWDVLQIVPDSSANLKGMFLIQIHP